MAKVTLTANLKKYFPHREVQIPGDRLMQILNAMEAMRPNFLSYILEDDGAIRKHVNIFIDGHLLRDKANPDVAVDANCSIHIMQALSGG